MKPLKQTDTSFLGYHMWCEMVYYEWSNEIGYLVAGLAVSINDTWLGVKTVVGQLKGTWCSIAWVYCDYPCSTPDSLLCHDSEDNAKPLGVRRQRHTGSNIVTNPTNNLSPRGPSKAEDKRVYSNWTNSWEAWRHYTWRTRGNAGIWREVNGTGRERNVSTTFDSYKERRLSFHNKQSES